MDLLIFNILFWGVFVGGGSLFVIFAFFMAFSQYKQHKSKQAPPKKTSAEEIPVTQIQTEVVDLLCGIKTSGIRTPKTEKTFYVVMKTENGEYLRFPVPEELYDGFDMGQTGTLTMAGSSLYGFVPKEREI